MIDDIAQYLADAGLGTVATNIFASYQPASPDDCITVLDAGGPEPLEIADIKNPSFQVLIRNSNYDNGKTTFDSVRSRLQSTKNTTIGNTFFYYILLVSEGGHIGRDDVGRDEWSLNFRTQIR